MMLCSPNSSFNKNKYNTGANIKQNTNTPIGPDMLLRSSLSNFLNMSQKYCSLHGRTLFHIIAIFNIKYQSTDITIFQNEVAYDSHPLPPSWQLHVTCSKLKEKH